MDVLKAAQTYVKKMITEVPGMKVLLLDQHTVCRRPLFPPTPTSSVVNFHDLGGCVRSLTL
jgi:hypothetical protein